MNDVKAHEGQWYSDRATRDTFCVIHVDEIDRLIDVRDTYGDIDEFDFDEWAAMDLEICIAPDVWVLADESDEDDSDAQPAPRPSG